ncbi:MAG: ribosomal-processing cysteine protease Prp [Leptospiraceae bacterium]|nr:ribosomal-processing cysteine protease Prp [Leptospiraceae bacterium]
MIQAEFKKDSEGNYNYLKIEGHSPKSLGVKGENLLCAAVSSLTQSLFLYLKKGQKLESFEIKEGFLELRLKSRSKEQEVFLMVIVGLQDLQSQFKENLELKI